MKFTYVSEDPRVEDVKGLVLLHVGLVNTCTNCVVKDPGATPGRLLTLTLPGVFRYIDCLRGP